MAAIRSRFPSMIMFINNLRKLPPQFRHSASSTEIARVRLKCQRDKLEWLFARTSIPPLLPPSSAPILKVVQSRNLYICEVVQSCCVFGACCGGCRFYFSFGFHPRDNRIFFAWLHHHFAEDYCAIIGGGDVIWLAILFAYY